MNTFKFLSPIKNRNRRQRQGRATYSSFSYQNPNDDSGNEINFVFIWSGDDIRTNDYSTCIYQGYIKDFGYTYDNHEINDDEILYLFPTIEYIFVHRYEREISEGFTHHFTDPEEMVTISFKLYKNNETI